MTEGTDFPTNESNSDTASERAGIVVARGTGEGLILRLDGRVPRPTLVDALVEYVDSRSAFFSGQEVTLEWIGARPEDGVVAELSSILNMRFNLLVKASRMFERPQKPNRPMAEAAKWHAGDEVADALAETPRSKLTVRPQEDNRISPVATMRGGEGPRSLFDGVAAFSGASPAPSQVLSDKNALATEALLWDEPDCRLIRDTLRGGQKIESEHSVVVVGDVNSGAEIVAGGDVFVLGRLRGVAHAGAYDESGGGRAIFAMVMQPTQLRIGSIISQGSSEGGRNPEIARIEGNIIVVEPYALGSSGRRSGLR